MNDTIEGEERKQQGMINCCNGPTNREILTSCREVDKAVDVQIQKGMTHVLTCEWSVDLGRRQLRSFLFKLGPVEGHTRKINCIE